jgi:hypothetical protein
MLEKYKVQAGLAAVLITACPATWAADEWKFGTGYNYSSGDYGDTVDTEITSIPFSLTYETGPWSVKVTVPYLRITGPGDVVPGVGRGRRGGTTAPTTTVQTNSGLGDVVVAGTYNVYNDVASGVAVDLGGKIKFGTADIDKNLGTGENDYGVQVDAYKTLGKWTVFSGLGFTALGSSPTVPLDNVFNINAGGTYKISSASSAGLSYDYRQKSSDTGHPQSELTAFFVHKFDQTWKAQTYLMKGFSDGSPDWGGGASIAYAF